MLYNQIKKCVNSGQNHVWVSLSLPGQESEDSNGNYKVVADSKMTAQEMFDVLAENWEESYLKNELLTRMISVLAMDGVRRAFADYCEANPNATQDERDAFAQNFADSGWNVSLKHPASDRKAQSVEKKQAKAVSIIEDASVEVQTALVEKMLKANPSLLEALENLQLR